MADIGQTLREARMRARIDISEVESRTKIRARYLRAIENEEWDLLPGPVYIKSFLRTYADYLGLDSRLLVDEFKRRYEGPTEHELRPPSSLRRERERERERTARGPRGPLLPPWAIIGLVLVGVVVALYVIGSGTGNNRPTPTGAQGKHHRRSHVTTTPVVVHRRPRPRLVKLRLVPTGTVYVCVEKPSGQRLIPGATFTLGQTIPPVIGRELYVILGNNLVRMTVNRKPYTVAPSSTAIDLKVLPTGVTPLAPGVAPTCA
jgi:hypothetical protein